MAGLLLVILFWVLERESTWAACDKSRIEAGPWEGLALAMGADRKLGPVLRRTVWARGHSSPL